MQNRNSSIVFLYMKSKCANFACVLLDQQGNICTLKKFQKLICFPGKLTFKKCIVLECGTVVYHRTTDVKVLSGRSSNPTTGDLFF